MKIRCNGCGYVGNGQNPGDASMRMFGGKRPFDYVADTTEPADPVGKVMHRAGSAS